MRNREEVTPKAVLFDIEGTLIDTVEVYFKGINEICRRMGFEELDKETVRNLLRTPGPPWDYLIPEEEKDRERLIEQCRKLDEEIWPKVYEQEVKPLPEAIETLDKLVAQGIKVGLVSSGWGFQFDRFDWGRKMVQLAAVVITRDDVPVLKPAPDAIIECLQRLQTSPADVIYVGDSPSDIKAGKAAGTITVGVLTGASDYEILQPEHPDAILHGVQELLAFIGAT